MLILLEHLKAWREHRAEIVDLADKAAAGARTCRYRFPEIGDYRRAGALGKLSAKRETHHDRALGYAGKYFNQSISSCTFLLTGRIASSTKNHRSNMPLKVHLLMD